MYQSLKKYLCFISIKRIILLLTIFGIRILNFGLTNIRNTIE